MCELADKKSSINIYCSDFDAFHAKIRIKYKMSIQLYFQFVLWLNCMLFFATHNWSWYDT